MIANLLAEDEGQEGARQASRTTADRIRASYELIDVFTTTAFGGNQLAVFTDAREIPDGQLQRIARELNLSETAFAYPLSHGEWKLRIFTPTMEHSFAGHPTIGSALVLGAGAGLSSVTLHEPIGPVHVTFHILENATQIARLAVPAEVEEGNITTPISDLAAMLSLAIDDLGGGSYRPHAMACGVPFLFIRVKDVEALGRAKLKRDVWENTISKEWAPHVYIYAKGDTASEIKSRMFAPLMGIDEDPATGGAAAALASVLAADDPTLEGPMHWNIVQGVEMGRPSHIELTALMENGRASQVTVGGAAVTVGRGWLDVPLAGGIAA